MAGSRVRRLLRAVARVTASDRAAEVIYRHGIRNRADEIVQGSPGATALMNAGLLTMGDYSYYAPTVHIFAGDTAGVRVGRFTSIAQGVGIFVGGAHRTDWVTTYGLRAVFMMEGAYEDGTPASNGDVEIGSDCWIAAEAIILSGVTIGHGAVVATRAVVTSDVRPYAIVAGNPAREVRRRFPDEQVAALLRIGWWDWPVEKVLDRVAQLCSDDIQGFIDRYDPR